MPQQVEGHPFGRQETAGRTTHHRRLRSGGQVGPVPGFRRKAHAGVQEPESRLRHSQAGHPALGFEHQRPDRFPTLIDQGSGGQIAPRSQIFGKGLLQKVMEVSGTSQLRPTRSIRSTADRARVATWGASTTSWVMVASEFLMFSSVIFFMWGHRLQGRTISTSSSS